MYVAGRAVWRGLDIRTIIRARKSWAGVGGSSPILTFCKWGLGTHRNCTGPNAPTQPRSRAVTVQQHGQDSAPEVACPGSEPCLYLLIWWHQARCVTSLKPSQSAVKWGCKSQPPRMDGHWDGELRGFRRAGWVCHCYSWYPPSSIPNTNNTQSQRTGNRDGPGSHLSGSDKRRAPTPSAEMFPLTHQI